DSRGIEVRGHRSAFVAAQSLERFGWALSGRREDERLGQLIDIALRSRDLAQGAQPIERLAFGRRCEHRDEAAAVGVLDRFTLLHAPEELARPLTQLADAD